LLVALASPGLAETPSSDGAALAARASDAAKELRTYLADLAKAGERNPPFHFLTEWRVTPELVIGPDPLG